MNIDVDRCRRAMKHLRVYGDPAAKPTASHPCQNEGGRPRWKQIEAAINWIAQDGSTALMHEKAYVKNYASFGDQSGECSYGCGPRHGSIVFSIERTNGGQCAGVVLNADHIYLLECVRDAGYYKTDERYHRQGNLCDAIEERNKAERDIAATDAWLADVTVEARGLPETVVANERQNDAKRT